MRLGAFFVLTLDVTLKAPGVGKRRTAQWALLAFPIFLMSQHVVIQTGLGTEESTTLLALKLSFLVSCQVILQTDFVIEFFATNIACLISDVLVDVFNMAFQASSTRK